MTLAAAAGYAAEIAPPTPATPAAIPSQPARMAPDPDAPILLILNPQSPNPLSGYLGEILLAEGLHAFRTAWIDTLTPTLLNEFAVAILTEGPLTTSHAALFERYVTAGGALIAMRPDPALARLLGVTFLGDAGDGGRLQIVNHPIAPPGGPALQFHGPAIRLRPEGAETIAQVTDAGGAYPAVGIHSFGRGIAAFWAFDLGRSIALSRQGNPAYADQEHDDIDGVRTTDLFIGWVDLEQLQIPQADEQQRLFSSVVAGISAAPLPRLWYLPGEATSALIATGDAHGSYARFIDDVLQRVERRNGRMSIYYAPQLAGPLRRITRKTRWWLADLPLVGDSFEQQDPLPNPTTVARWRERGHEFGMHPYIEEGLEQGYYNYWTEFVKLGYGGSVPTVRTHRVLWRGWVANARVQAGYGTRMNLDYYHVGSAVRTTEGLAGSGFLTGSGLPMRFVDSDGSLLPVFQQHTHLVDEHLMEVFGTGKDMGLDAVAALAVSRAMLDNGRRGIPAAIGLQCHVDPFTMGGERAKQVGRWLDGTLDAAAERGIPILSAEQWLHFTEARHAVTIGDWHWRPDDQRLQFTITIPQGSGDDLRLLLPSEHRQALLRHVTIDGAPAHSSTHSTTIGRSVYVSAAIGSGYHTIEVVYSQ